MNVDRRVLLTEDARYRFKLRQLRKKMTPPLAEAQLEVTPSEELAKLSNFKELPDNTEIVRGSSAVTEANAVDILPFTSIMAIVTSYKYSINTWASGIVNFVIDTAKKLYQNKQEKFQLAPVHIIPKIGIGHQVNLYGLIFSYLFDFGSEGHGFESRLWNRFFCAKMFVLLRAQNIEGKHQSPYTLR